MKNEGGLDRPGQNHRLNSLESKKLDASTDTWHDVGGAGEPAFENSWVNYVAGYVVAAFRIDSDGFIHLKGMVKSGTIGQNIFTLPTGYRPAEREKFVVVSNGAIGHLDILADGSVKTIAGNNTWFNICGIIFKGA